MGLARAGSITQNDKPFGRQAVEQTLPFLGHERKCGRKDLFRIQSERIRGSIRFFWAVRLMLMGWRRLEAAPRFEPVRKVGDGALEQLIDRGGADTLIG